MDLSWITSYLPLGNSGLALIVLGLVALFVIRLVTRMASYLLIGVGILSALGLFAVEKFFDFGTPQWVQVANPDAAYVTDAATKPLPEGMPVCDRTTKGKVAVCWSNDVMGAAADVINELAPNSVPSAVCSYAEGTASDNLNPSENTQVFECK